MTLFTTTKKQVQHLTPTHKSSEMVNSLDRGGDVFPSANTKWGSTDGLSPITLRPIKNQSHSVNQGKYSINPNDYIDPKRYIVQIRMQLHDILYVFSHFLPIQPFPTWRDS